MAEPTLLQFEPFQSAIEATFWHTLGNNKINVYKLDDATVPIQGFYSSGDAFPLDRAGSSQPASAGGGAGAAGTAGAAAAPQDVLPARLCVNATSFSKLKRQINSREFLVPGTLKNTNTIEEFKAVDKNSLLKTITLEIWQDILSGAAAQDPRLLGRFLLLTFADLKKYKFYYWFAFPAILPLEPFKLETPVRPLAEVYGAESHGKPMAGMVAFMWGDKLTRSFMAYGQLDRLRSEYERFRAVSVSPGFFLLKTLENGGFAIADVAEFGTFFGEGQKQTIGFVDPSGLSENPGWPLRNFLALVATQWFARSVRVVCYRESSRRRDDISASIVLDVQLSAFADEPKSVGWEKGVQGKPSPRVADLAPLMDPTRLAETAVDLNLKLMRWRILPELQLDRISQTKCLLLGAGTLGCYVARILMAWGVRNITLVDNGKVSFSNPVRQPLFKFADCLDGGKPKAIAAAAALKEVFPGVNAVGCELSIPMPGHSIQSADVIKKNIAALEDLVRAHDAVFLLTDSRESRWLPTLLGASMGKIVLNAALGFDTFLVMRHGMRGTNPFAASAEGSDSPVSLGCYFCTDVVAPTDSLADRTLDQQCTVTRPGLSGIASALVVELLSSILSHPQGAWAPAVNETGVPGNSVLGAMPHQIRGSLGQFTNLLVVAQAFDKCPACSARVLDLYARNGHDFVLKGLASPKYLEEVSGLAELHSAGDTLDVEWDDDDDDDAM
ncbi:Autophagy protein 7 [Polyrhizophydium stewartii]|uniref:Ubiquitin-like modifier-activating enzyme ATG7 n=1 Tax=Polyrhizophydium stewartii TaxID=2732419 RepID=A0ABR4NHZ0_9FUNG